MAQALQAQWKTNLGIEVELQAEEQQVQVAERRSGDFQLARMRWTADFAIRSPSFPCTAQRQLQR